MEKEFTIALLIDSDNLSIDYYDIIMNELEEIGTIRYKRVYGNFDGSNPWTKNAIKNGITPIQAFAPVKGKNATDMVMAIDAMDIFYTGTVSAFCLATSDSDFARLAQRLKEGGMYVVVAGKEQSPESLNNSCNKFLMLDKLYEMSKASKDSGLNSELIVSIEEPKADKNTKKNETETIVSAPELKDIATAVDAIISERSHDGWAYYAEVVSQLEKKFPQFNYKLYGANGKQSFFKEKLGCEMETRATSAMIRMKPKNKNVKK